MFRTKFLGLLPTLALGGVLAGACGGPASPENVGSGSSAIRMEVDVTGLAQTEHFCMTWALYQAPTAGEGDWTLVDQRTDPTCAEPGVNNTFDFATCYDGRRFLVEYGVSFYQGSTQLGTAVATSGGGPNDLCVKNTDTDSRATVQFGEEGNAGGVNPGIDVDRVCSNDKIAVENGNVVSALWLQPESCVSGTPDDFVALGYGSGLNTLRTGVTTDGLTRFIFSTAPLDARWDVFYLAFEPRLATDVLHLYNAPWVLHHDSHDGSYGRETLDARLASYLYRDDGGTYAGFAQTAISDERPAVRVVYDASAGLDAPISLDARVQVMPYPTCREGLADPKGAIAVGGSRFELVFGCPSGEIAAIPCDARATRVPLCSAAILK